jgi:hypothetical protein
MTQGLNGKKDGRILNIIDYGQIGIIHDVMRCFNDAYDSDEMGLPF